jgi:hypothetical protein
LLFLLQASRLVQAGEPPAGCHGDDAEGHHQPHRPAEVAHEDNHEASEQGDQGEAQIVKGAGEPGTGSGELAPGLPAAPHRVERTGSFLEVGVAYVRFAALPAHFAVMFQPDMYRNDDPALAVALTRASRAGKPGGRIRPGNGG